jgi:predicted PurR-regulated permease PerM
VDIQAQIIVLIVGQGITLIFLLISVIWSGGQNQVAELKTTLNKEVEKIEAWKFASASNYATLSKGQEESALRLRELADAVRQLSNAVNQIPILVNRIENLERTIRKDRDT